MSSPRWNSSNEVFVPEIDNEHRALFRAIEDLRQALQSDTDSARTAAAVRGLISQVEAHFGHEETLMTKADFWGYGWHKGQHDTARKTLRKALRAVDQGDREKAGRAVQSMGSWLNDHTAIADRILGAFLRNLGRLSGSAAS